MSFTLTGLAGSPRPVPGLVVSTSTEGTATVISLGGEADVATLPGLLETLARVIADHDGTVIIDLAQTTFIDSATVRALDRARQFLDDHDRQLTVRSPSRLDAWVLGFFGLSHLLEPGAGAQR